MEIKIRHFLPLAILLICLFLPKSSLAAEGDIVWEKEDNPTPNYDFAFQTAVGADGVYVVGGENSLDVTTISCEAHSNWRVEKRNLDTGEQIWKKVLSNGCAIASAVDATGVYTAGAENSGAAWRVEKRNLNDGEVIWETPPLDFTGYQDIGRSIEVDDTGVYVAGSLNMANGSWTPQSVWRVEKRSLIDGSLIWGKEYNNGCYVDPGSGYTLCYVTYPDGSAIDATGVYAVGIQQGSAYWNGSSWLQYSKWQVEKRDLDTGEVIWQNVDSLQPGMVRANEAATDSSGLYIAGKENDGQIWRVEKRNSSDGSLVWKKTENFSPGAVDNARGITVGSSGAYSVGSQGSLWRIEKRNLNDGEVIWPKPLQYTTGADTPYQIVSDSSGMYIAGGINNRSIWRVEKRELIVPIAGQCKTPPNNQSFCPPSGPSGVPADLCTQYDPARPPTFSGSGGPWSWTCFGQYGGSDMPCQAVVGTAVNAQCGLADGGSFCQGRMPTDADLCSAGTPNPSASSIDINTYQTDWQCQDSGACGGSTASCSARGTKACGWIETNP